MIVVMSKTASEQEIRAVSERLSLNGFDVHLFKGAGKAILAAVGNAKNVESLPLEAMAGVEKVVPIQKPYTLASREFVPEDTVVNVDGVLIGGKEPVVIAGPCAVESREQLLKVAKFIKDVGVKMLRGGAFKPRSSPYSFQGLELEGLKILREAKDETGLRIVSEVLDPRHVEVVADYVDMLQIGARNMQNFTLLKEVGQTMKPILLKRGFMSTVEEWLMAAEYIMAEGNYSIVLCERGIRTFEPSTRNTLDLSSVPLVKNLSHLPVIVDPSHGTGNWRLVGPMAKAALAAGADGIMVEVHPNPCEALSDGPQSLSFENFAIVMDEIWRICSVLDFSK